MTNNTSQLQNQKNHTKLINKIHKLSKFKKKKWTTQHIPHIVHHHNCAPLQVATQNPSLLSFLKSPPLSVSKLTFHLKLHDSSNDEKTRWQTPLTKTLPTETIHS